MLNTEINGQESLSKPEEPAVKVEETVVTESPKSKRKARKNARREAHRQRRKERRAAYKALSGGRKFLRWLIGIALGIAGLCLLCFVGYKIYYACMVNYVENKYQESLQTVAPQEEILKAAPEDTEGAARVAATKAFGPEDTWVIYLYMCGSNLESQGRSKLSDVTAYYVNRENQAYLQQQKDVSQQRFHTFIDEMQQKGMSLPEYLFLPSGNEAQEESESGGESEQEGCATKNLNDIFTVDLPQNVSIVIQTGGANNWTLPMINPNASERFLYNSQGFAKLTSTYPKNMGNEETFTDFLQFCKTEYPADHQMLLLWNHGSGPFGFCSDEMFSGDCITLSEMSGALSKVFGVSPAKPPFELVGFDACLMASTEVAQNLYGYTKYLAASEETEVGDGWAYAKWLSELAAHPEMNGAQLGKAIADSFVEHCANFSINMKWLNFETVATFSVVDVMKAHEVYTAYTDLCATALKDTAEDPWPLAALGRAATKSIRYAGSYYKYLNTIDLGTFMDNLSEDYPKQAKRVLNALDDAVLYHRETSYTQGSQGLSIFFPTNVDSLTGLIYYLEYMDAVCTDPNMKALYYYKIAGCLNDELQKYASDAGYGVFQTLDTTPLKGVADVKPTVNADNTIQMPISNQTASLVQDICVSVAQFDEGDNTLCFYGDDTCLYLDEYRNLCTTFDGKWVMLDGHVLSLEVIDQNDAFIRYRSPIQYDGNENSYLVLAYDCAGDTFSVLGVQAMNEEADTLGRNLEPVEIGKTITPCYRKENLLDASVIQTYGDTFTFQPGSKIEYAPLKDGAYYLAIILTDTRGDAYYPSLISFRMENGVIAEMSATDELVAYTSID